MMKRSVTCRLGASTATGMFCRQLLVKGNGTAPARGSVQRTGYTGKGETGSRSSMRPISISRSKILGQLTHNGRATASSVEVQRDVVGSSNKASGGGHASSPTSLTTSYPLMLHALDTYQPWMDAEAGEMVHPGPPAPIPGFGNRQAELLHLSNNGHTHTASTTIMHLAVNEKDRILDVRWADGHVSHFHMIWLRDHDYSDMNATNQRNTDTGANISIHLVPLFIHCYTSCYIYSVLVLPACLASSYHFHRCVQKLQSAYPSTCPAAALRIAGGAVTSAYCS